MLSDDDPENSALYMRVNASGTQCLAAAAAGAGISRFIYLSSVKVNGEQSAGHAYMPTDAPHPQDDYGRSKWAAERHLGQLGATANMRVVIVRPPLVYGPGVRANFLRLMQWVDKGWPLPLGSVRNTRSLVNVWNLCDLLTNLTRNPAAGGTWMVSDREIYPHRNSSAVSPALWADALVCYRFRWACCAFALRLSIDSKNLRGCATR